MFNFEYAAFLRHGEAQNNEAERLHKAGELSAYDGYVTRPPSFHRLTEIGKKQSSKTGEWIKRNSLVFKHQVVSAHLRGIETAYLLDIAGAQWDVDDRFCEKDSGVFHEMVPHEAAAYRARFKNRAHEIDPYRFRPDRGHSFFDTEMIARSAVSSLKDSTLVVCHGHLMRVIDHIVMGGEHSWDMGSWKDATWDVPNCALIEYTRRSPITEILSDTRWWRRMSLPYEDKLGRWEEIVRPRFDNEALKNLVEKISSRLR